MRWLLGLFRFMEWLTGYFTLLCSAVDNCNENVASLNDLVRDLNETGDLALFIRSMRRQFKQLA